MMQPALRLGRFARTAAGMASVRRAPSAPMSLMRHLPQPQQMQQLRLTGLRSLQRRALHTSRPSQVQKAPAVPGQKKWQVWSAFRWILSMGIAYAIVFSANTQKDNRTKNDSRKLDTVLMTCISAEEESQRVLGGSLGRSELDRLWKKFDSRNRGALSREAALHLAEELFDWYFELSHTRLQHKFEQLDKAEQAGLDDQMARLRDGIKAEFRQFRATRLSDAIEREYARSADATVYRAQVDGTIVKAIVAYSTVVQAKTMDYARA